MKIIVGIKRVIDYRVKVRLRPDGSDVDLENTKMAINPFCEIALEEALRLREAGLAEEVIAVSIGGSNSSEQLRSALALGADKAILVDTETAPGPLNVAKLFAQLVQREQAGLILFGKQAIDSDNNQAGQMLAALLGCAQATSAYKLEASTDSIVVNCEVDSGLRSFKMNYPAVITVDLRLNEPRFAKLPDIMKAKRKPLETLKPDDLGVSLKQHSQLVKVTPPTERSAGEILQSVDELLDKLTNEAKILEVNK